MQRGNKRNRQLDQWVGTPLLNVAATFRRRRKPPTVQQRIGLMCSPALGDTLLFSAVLADIRAARPQAHIVHICMQQNLAAAEIIAGADERLLIALTSPLESIRRLRRAKLDVLLDFTSWQRLTAFYTMMSGAAYSVGFDTPGQPRSRAYDGTVAHTETRHELENFRALVRGAGLLPVIHVGQAPTVAVPPPAAPLFAEEQDIVAFHPWASGQKLWLREWPEENWVELARTLDNGRTLFLLTGGPGDRARTDALAARIRSAGLRCEGFISPDGFRTLTQLLRRCRLVVSVNTGVMHLSAIAGASTLSINGPTRNSRWGPIGPRARGVIAPGNGCGYLHLGFEFDGQPTDCMQRTTVAQVAAAAAELAHTA